MLKKHTFKASEFRTKTTTRIQSFRNFQQIHDMSINPSMVAPGVLLANDVPDSCLEVSILVRLDKRVDGSDSAGLVVTLVMMIMSIVGLMVGLVVRLVVVAVAGFEDVDGRHVDRVDDGTSAGAEADGSDGRRAREVATNAELEAVRSCKQSSLLKF